MMQIRDDRGFTGRLEQQTDNEPSVIFRNKEQYIRKTRGEGCEKGTTRVQTQNTLMEIKNMKEEMKISIIVFLRYFKSQRMK